MLARVVSPQLVLADLLFGVIAAVADAKIPLVRGGQERYSFPPEYAEGECGADWAPVVVCLLVLLRWSDTG